MNDFLRTYIRRDVFKQVKGTIYRIECKKLRDKGLKAKQAKKKVNAALWRLLRNA